ncbi:MAG: transglycosylase SLT domain-containing protein [Gammaproteobacteria bacterium]|nr:transglycosylase SLT domain-containing protein [Gammaproteobacteria bacterium]MDH3465475.1 transglycosylase SLT domain-containing protein [Gammaproteobacteria bacterium]
MAVRDLGIALLITGLLVVLLIPGRAVAPVDHSSWPVRYDYQFSKYSKRYFGPMADRRWFKAQAIVESNLRPDAVSPVGAHGLMQISPIAYAEIRRQHPYIDTPEGPRWNIASGVYLMRQLFDRWTRKVTGQQQWWFALASYNAGFQRLLDARRIAREHHRDDAVWSDVAEFVPRETHNYVHRVRQLMNAAQTSSN